MLTHFSGLLFGRIVGKTGRCHICGSHGELSFEHVPPRSAFNDRPLLVMKGQEVIGADPDNLRGGRQSQRGAGGYTLCGRCNNSTGAWYGPAFAGWTHQAMRILLATRGQASLYYTFHIFPLRVIKQVACMFFSVNSPEFADAQPELVRFVLNRQSCGLPDRFRFFTYYNASERGRALGVTGTLNIASGTARVLSEVTLSPLGYVLSLNSAPPDNRLVEFTFMARYHYNDWKHISLRLPVLPVFTYVPGDYRDRKTVLEEATQNQLAADAREDWPV